MHSTSHPRMLEHPKSWPSGKSLKDFKRRSKDIRLVAEKMVVNLCDAVYTAKANCC